MARRALLTMLAALATAAGGCGDGGPSAAVADRMERAAQRASEAEDFEMVGSMKSTFPQARFSLSGTFIQTADSVRGLMQDVTFEMQGQRFTADLINVGDDFWMRGGPFDRILPAGKRWLHSTEAGPTVSLAQFFRFLGETSEVREVGSERVRGHDTDHFECTLDIDTLAEVLGATAPEEFADGTATEDFSMTLDVWLDASDQIRRIEVEGGLDGTSQRMEASFVVTDYDTGVTIEPPPAAEVAELPA